jgi:predicted kinase
MRWIDPVNDVAFLTMDLHAHGRADLAAQVMDGWLQQTGDFEGLATWRFYEVYRALVRCMVAGLPSGDARVGRRYADLLDRWTAPPANARPPLLITCGASGSGKSTVAAEVMVRLGAVRVRSDVERKRLFGLDALADSHASGLRIYTPEASDQTFARLAGLARGVLQAGWPVVVDAAFLRQAQRAPFARLAAELGAPFHILLCEAPPDTLRERIAARRTHGRDASEATPELIAQQLQALEPLTAEEETHALRIDTRQADWRERIATAVGSGGAAHEGRHSGHGPFSEDQRQYEPR